MYLNMHSRELLRLEILKKKSGSKDIAQVIAQISAESADQVSIQEFM